MQSALAIMKLGSGGQARAAQPEDWTGMDSEAPDRTFIRHRVPKAISSSWEEALGLVTTSPHTDTSRFRREVAPIVDRFGRECQSAVEQLWRPGVAGVCVEGLPVGTLGAPPTGTDHPDGKDWCSEGSLLGVACRLTGAEPFSFRAEAEGRAIHNVTPNPRLVGCATGGGSGVRFSLHVEAAFSEVRPDALAIFCLRGHPDAGTTVAPVRTALNVLTQPERDELRRAQFLVQVPQSFRHPGGAQTVVGPVPIITGPERDPALRANFVSTTVAPGASQSAGAALVSLEAAMESIKRVYYLTPGSLLLINNAAAAHGRTAFQTTDFGLNARWLQRVYLTKDVSRQQADPSTVTFV